MKSNIGVSDIPTLGDAPFLRQCRERFFNPVGGFTASECANTLKRSALEEFRVQLGYGLYGAKPSFRERYDLIKGFVKGAADELTKLDESITTLETDGTLNDPIDKGAPLYEHVNFMLSEFEQSHLDRITDQQKRIVNKMIKLNEGHSDEVLERLDAIMDFCSSKGLTITDQHRSWRWGKLIGDDGMVISADEGTDLKTVDLQRAVRISLPSICFTVTDGADKSFKMCVADYNQTGASNDYAFTGGGYFLFKGADFSIVLDTKKEFTLDGLDGFLKQNGVSSKSADDVYSAVGIELS